MLYRIAQTFIEQCPPGALVGLDYSSSCVGVAITDHLRQISNPLRSITNNGHKATISGIEDTLRNHTYTGYILGWPLQFNGQVGENCPAIERFAQAIIKVCQKPVLLFDERFTSKIALSLLKDDYKTHGQRKKVADKVAASVLLESFLLSLKHG